MKFLVLCLGTALSIGGYANPSLDDLEKRVAFLEKKHSALAQVDELLWKTKQALASAIEAHQGNSNNGTREARWLSFVNWLEYSRKTFISVRSALPRAEAFSRINEFNALIDGSLPNIEGYWDGYRFRKALKEIGLTQEESENAARRALEALKLN